MSGCQSFRLSGAITQQLFYVYKDYWLQLVQRHFAVEAEDNIQSHLAKNGADFVNSNANLKEP